MRQRTGSTDIHALGGAARTMPQLATGFLICALAGVGMPGTSSFPGEFMLIIAGIGIYPGPWIEIVRPAAEAWAAGLRQ